MALLSTTLPLALTNVLLLIVMSILVWRALASDTQISLYRRSTFLLYCIKYGALLSIAARYLAQFYLLYETSKRVANQSSDEDEDKGDADKDINESESYHITALLFGYSNDLFVVRLISLTLILIISNVQLVIT